MELLRMNPYGDKVMKKEFKNFKITVYKMTGI